MESTLCPGCTRFIRSETRSRPPTCAAFPDGIPEDIYPGGFDHRQEHPGDHGIRFEPIAYADIGAKTVEGYERTQAWLASPR